MKQLKRFNKIHRGLESEKTRSWKPRPLTDHGFTADFLPAPLLDVVEDVDVDEIEEVAEAEEVDLLADDDEDEDEDDDYDDDDDGDEEYVDVEDDNTWQ